MGEKLFCIYCGLWAIEGWYEEKSECDAILRLAKPREKAIVLFYANGTNEWIYGQCNFIHEKGHIAPFKFLNSYENLRGQRVLPTLIDSHGVDSVFFLEEKLMDRFSNDPSTRRYRSCFELLKKEGSGYHRSQSTFEKASPIQKLMRIFKK
jgi:hypothetical protein